MATLQQMKQSLDRTWETVSEGWRQLVDLAGGALTKFNPVRRSGGEMAENEGLGDIAGARWGLIAAEVFDNDHEVVVTLEAPGMEASDFDIQVHDNVLVVRGEKKFRREQRHGEYHLVERAYGRFERAVALPAAVDDAQASASYRRGLLRIALPKRPTAQRRRISVSNA